MREGVESVGEEILSTLSIPHKGPTDLYIGPAPVDIGPTDLYIGPAHVVIGRLVALKDLLLCVAGRNYGSTGSPLSFRIGIIEMRGNLFLSGHELSTYGPNSFFPGTTFRFRAQLFLSVHGKREVEGASQTSLPGTDRISRFSDKTKQAGIYCRHILINDACTLIDDACTSTYCPHIRTCLPGIAT
jgi:hypothetical protein